MYSWGGGGGVAVGVIGIYNDCPKLNMYVRLFGVSHVFFLWRVQHLT